MYLEPNRDDRDYLYFESKGEIEEIAKEILELAISKHHGGLPDCIDESGNRAFLLGFTESDKSNEKYAYQEIKRGLNGLALDLQSNFRGSAEDIACFLKKIKSLRLSKDSIYFYLGLLVKLIYSRLVDADRTDAACFETRKQYRPNAVDWQNLISRLDKSMRSFDSSSEITFRGRFSSKEQALLVDSASSQKINSTLRWLVNNHGTLTGNQAIVVWAIKRPEEKPVLNPQSGSFDFDDSFSSIADESKALHDDISDALNATNVQYAKIFSRVLRGYEGAEDLKKHNDPMVVVILDAATTGRLGVTFYCELQKDEYIKRILQWHVDAAWPLTSFKKSIVEGAERVNVVQYEGAPSFTDIINCACDTSDRSSKSYKRFAKDVKERLIECIIRQIQQLVKSRSPYGERGLKWCELHKITRFDGRSPYGERGLKLGAVAGRQEDQVALLTESVD